MKKRHRWEYWGYDEIEGHLHFCVRCPTAKHEPSWLTSRTRKKKYLHRDGKWRAICPPCKPEKVEEK